MLLKEEEAGDWRGVDEDFGDDADASGREPTGTLCRSTWTCVSWSLGSDWLNPFCWWYSAKAPFWSLPKPFATVCLAMTGTKETTEVLAFVTGLKEHKCNIVTSKIFKKNTGKIITMHGLIKHRYRSHNAWSYKTQIQKSQCMVL